MNRLVWMLFAVVVWEGGKAAHKYFSTVKLYDNPNTGVRGIVTVKKKDKSMIKNLERLGFKKK